MDFDIIKNFNHVFVAISNKGVKRTAFAKAMGYSSTAQLSSTLEGEAMISTKAIIELIKNFSVNPTFLFTGQGEMFLGDESELESLRKENNILQQNNAANQNHLMELIQINEKLNQRNAELIDITSAAIKYHKEHKDEPTITKEEK
jgi:hypothetical protein